MSQAALVVAIDGPAASGKGTIARRLAAEFSLAYLDTGSLYRQVAFLVLEAGGEPTDEADALAAAKAVAGRDIEDDKLRNQLVADAASKVAAIPALRTALVDFQKEFGRNPPDIDGVASNGAVIDGRDIGTVIFPDAPVKLFVSASAEERARRRHLELLDRGNEASFGDILTEVKERDARDEARPISPLMPAADAHLLDTTDLSIEAAFEAAKSIVAAAF